MQRLLSTPHIRSSSSSGTCSAAHDSSTCAWLPAQEAFDSRPLAQLLSAEGLTKPLREALLYAVAMADADQEAAASDRPESNGLAGEPAVYSSTGADLPDVQQAHVSKGHSDQQARNLPAADGAWASSGGGLTAAEGKMAFARYLASVSRWAGAAALLHAGLPGTAVSHATYAYLRHLRVPTP